MKFLFRRVINGDKEGQSFKEFLINAQNSKNIAFASKICKGRLTNFGEENKTCAIHGVSMDLHHLGECVGKGMMKVVMEEAKKLLANNEFQNHRSMEH
jgi:hypothetical protein